MLGYNGPICSSQGRATLKNGTVPQFRFVGCLIYFFKHFTATNSNFNAAKELLASIWFDYKYEIMYKYCGGILMRLYSLNYNSLLLLNSR